ncbi:putative G-protein coupled receptor Mth-like 12 [Lycorma delicatula]|uniref:putative G-protein coupled receptor Mth-like 12 n=1 Tax=Lycorma delicatula TaxID=130591 RepID=UPI003F518217
MCVSLFVLVILFSIIVGGNKNPCEKGKSVTLYDMKDTDDRRILSGGIKYKDKIFNDGKNNMGCICMVRNCLRKCCQGEYMMSINLTCIPIDRKLKGMVDFFGDINFYTLNETLKPIKRSNINKEDYKIIYNSIDYNRYSFHEIGKVSEQAYLLLNGTLLINSSNGALFTTKDVKNYCLEWFDDHDTVVPFIFVDNQIYKRKEYGTSFLILSSVFSCISLLLLLLTFFIYYTTSDLKNLAGRCLMGLISSLCTYYSAFVFHELILVNNVLASDFMYYCELYANQSSFFWLNVLCYDIWLVFSGSFNIHISTKRDEKRTFIKYAGYAWGIPFIICIIHFNRRTLGSYIESSVYVGPFVVLLIFNTVMLFTITLKTCKCKQRNMFYWKIKALCSFRRPKRRLFLYFKCFYIISISRAVASLSAFFENLEWLWKYFCLFSAVDGIIIFVIFVYRSHVFWIVSEKLCPSLNIFKCDGKQFNTFSQYTTSVNESIENKRCTIISDSLKTNIIKSDIEMESYV